MELFAWNAVMTVLLALLGWAVKSKDAELAATKEELARVTILINRTREEVAKEYVTKNDLHLDINRVLDRLDRLDNKLDTFIKEHRNG
jgi:hypothetical protein